MPYEINGKQTDVEDVVEYTDPYKQKRKATIKHVEPKNGSHHATLDTEIDGNPTSLEDVPWHAEGVQHSWRHITE